ncbi:DNA replication/repair protein RecF [Brevibacterium ravenspurgense]|uniref:DNA replication/repair protein RecF n=1 Tax=Brevibacterium ravenspurgense TaxID=479117 RepID=UPI0007827791|nr:DNA replication/repair protein RecF [Brevibacterium ravenspurgense]
MWVSRLILDQFRSYSRLDLELAPGVTVFLAPNGWGKTNLVEALGYVSTLRSHRVTNDFPLVHTGSERAVVSALAHRGKRQVRVEVTIKAKGANTARINKQAVRVRELLGLLPAVVFAPEDLGLVKGEPAERRAYLDELLVALTPRYSAVIADFDRALKQRNALLKSLRKARYEERSGAADDPLRASLGLEATLEIWDHAFARAAAALVTGRLDLLDQLAEPLADDFARLAEDARPERRTAAATYASRVDYSVIDRSLPGAQQAMEDLILDELAKRRRVEIERGVTLVGPQRDDLDLHIGGTPAKGYASHGESWSLALALRLASWRVLQANPDEPDDSPVLVLDDVFSELDEGRTRRLADIIQEAQQVLITTAVAGHIPKNLTGEIIDLTAGTSEADQAGGQC